MKVLCVIVENKKQSFYFGEGVRNQKDVLVYENNLGIQ